MNKATTIMLTAAMLPALSQAQTIDICDRTQQVRDEILLAVGENDCATATAWELAQIDGLCFARVGYGGCRSSYSHPALVSLKHTDFDDLPRLDELELGGNHLTTLPVGVFDGFDGPARLQKLSLFSNHLSNLPEGVFDRLNRLAILRLAYNRFTALPDGLFDSLTSLQILQLNNNQLSGLKAGLFDSLRNLAELDLHNNQLTALPDGLFDSLTRLRWHLDLRSNQLSSLPAGLFDRLARLQSLYLSDNQLSELPAGLFDGLASLRYLDLRNNHLVGLTENDPLFARLPSGVELQLGGQTEAPEGLEGPAQRIAAAVPLMIPASDSMRQGFVRIINQTDQSGSVRILAFDDAGNAASPIEIQLGASQSLHFNSNDLEGGNPGKGINAGVGSPMRGDWRLDVETALNVRVLSFVRTTDGFLTAMGEVLQRDTLGRLMAQTFNPGQNRNQISRLRLVNTGANAESVSIEGVDDQGNNAGPVTLTLAAGESRTLSASDLENGAQGLIGTLGDGEGKWRLFVTAGQSVTGMSLLESPTGHLTNISTMGVATEDQ